MTTPSTAMVSLVADEDAAGEHDPASFADHHHDEDDPMSHSMKAVLDIMGGRGRLSRTYGKEKKQDILCDAVSLERHRLFLGETPSSGANQAYRTYSVQTRNKRRWMPAVIARPLYELGRFVHGLHSARGGTKFARPATALVIFYETAIQIHHEEEAKKQAQLVSAQAKLAKAKSRKPKENPLPDDYRHWRCRGWGTNLQ